MIQNGTISFFTLLTLLTACIGQVNAEEFVVSGNGDSSQNTITINRVSETSVEQTNTVVVENNIQSYATTGENTASSNTGDVAIATGDVTSRTSIENSGNVSMVQAGCCPTTVETNIAIAGNGENSENLIDIAVQNKTAITITQIATIVSSLATNANSGNNSANDNGGKVSIDTGNITVNQNLENTFINLVHVSAFDPGLAGDLSIRIVNNGNSSENSIFPKWFRDFFITVDSRAYIANLLDTHANTGGNSANGNNGDVAIVTGDVTIGVELKNGPINTSVVQIGCCPQVGGPPVELPVPPQPPAPPVGGPPPGGGGNGGGGNGGGGDGGKGGDVAATVGAILPVTGFNWFLATIANIVMFYFGLYLRRRSGRSPAPAYILA